MHRQSSPGAVFLWKDVIAEGRRMNNAPCLRDGEPSNTMNTVACSNSAPLPGGSGNLAWTLTIQGTTPDNDI